MKKIIISLCTILALTACKYNQKPAKSFTQWCQEKSTLPQKTKYTVELLLKEAGTQNCEDANRELSESNFFNFTENGISDLEPLANLSNLTDLDLSSNKISDIKPLSSFTNLVKSSSSFFFLD